MQLLLTITETCEALNIGRSSLYRLIGEGKIPARKVGRKTLLLRADIEEFAASLTTA